MWYIASEENEVYLAHHGIKGQKWGKRRYQNEDGTLTAEGKKRYGTIENYKKIQRRKKIATGAAIAGTALAVGGSILAYKRHKNKKSLENEKINILKNLDIINESQKRIQEAHNKGSQDLLKYYERTKKIAENDLKRSELITEYLKAHKFSSDSDVRKKGKKFIKIIFNKNII